MTRASLSENGTRIQKKGWNNGASRQNVYKTSTRIVKTHKIQSVIIVKDMLRQLHNMYLIAVLTQVVKH